MAVSPVKQLREQLRRAHSASGLSTHDTFHHQKQREAHASRLTHHHRKSLCTNTLKGISLSQKEHVICTKWQWVFSTNLILS